MPTYNFKAPALPLPTPEYDKGQQDQFMNALRLYFNRLDSYNQETAININSQNVLKWADAGTGFWIG